MSDNTTEATRADVCALACADAWRGDGEILASPMAPVPSIGARLARHTFEPDLLLSDGEAAFVHGTWGLGTTPGPAEGYIPYRAIFDLVWTGNRHVMMGPSQIDMYGNANISAIGDFAKPKRQLLGVRGAPGNTTNHPTSYWVPKHTTRTFVPKVDIISGVGYDSAKAAGAAASKFLDLRRVVTNLCVIDFETDDNRMRLRSLHPGVTVNEVIENTGFELVVDGDVPTSEVPDTEQLALINELLDPKGWRFNEVPKA